MSDEGTEVEGSLREILLDLLFVLFLPLITRVHRRKKR